LTATDPINTKRISTSAYEIQLLDNGIIEINWAKEVEEITLELLKEIKSIIYDFGSGKKMPVFISTINFLNINPEARKYAASKAGQEFTLANAVLIDNLGKNIMFNFFLKINKPSTPTKAFRTREEALEWLLSL
jgi:hypothetical protein